MKEVFYRFIRILALGLVNLLYWPKITGREHMPEQGAAIVCCNHISLWDPVLVGCALRRRLRFMAKAELFSNAAFGALLRALSAFPVKRGESDMAALRTSLNILKEDGVLGIFPQGTRDKDGSHPMESGVALIALRSGAPVIPVLIEGPYRIFHRTRVTVGKPVDLGALSGKYDSSRIREVTSTIESALWSLKRNSDAPSV